jgi:hypothetical protein
VEEQRWSRPGVADWWNQILILIISKVLTHHSHLRERILPHQQEIFGSCERREVREVQERK